MDDKKYHIQPEDAEKIRSWLLTRGGVAHWRSVDLSDPGKSWSTPALQENGEPYQKPTWQAESSPSSFTRDIADVIVDVPREVRRFHVALRMGSQGLKVKCTSGSSNRIWSAVAVAKRKHGKEAWYEFDYMTQEAVIFVADRSIPLAQWPELKKEAPGSAS